MSISRTATTERGVAFDFNHALGLGEVRSRLPVLFQHGLGVDRTLWDGWVAASLSVRSSVTLDMRGHGESISVWHENSKLDDFSDDLVSVLDACGIEQCHFVGESFGGTVGLHAALKWPQRFASVATFSSGWKGAWINDVRDWEPILRKGDIDEWSRLLSDARFVPGAVGEDIRDWVERHQRGMQPEVVWDIAKALLETDLEEELATMALPLMAVQGASPLIDPRNTRELLKLVPHAEIVRIPAARHAIVMSHWRECFDAASAFMERTERASRELARTSRGAEPIE